MEGKVPLTPPPPSLNKMLYPFLTHGIPLCVACIEVTDGSTGHSGVSLVQVDVIMGHILVFLTMKITCYIMVLNVVDCNESMSFWN